MGTVIISAYSMASTSKINNTCEYENSHNYIIKRGSIKSIGVNVRKMSLDEWP